MRSAGLLRDLCRVYRPVVVDDDVGGHAVSSWAAGAEFRALVEARGGREFLQAGAVRSAMNYAIECWARADVAIGDRLLLLPVGAVVEVVELQPADRRRRRLGIAAIAVDNVSVTGAGGVVAAAATLSGAGS
jgi:head-tail adaptor